MWQARSPFDPRAEKLFVEWLARRDAGEPVDFAELCRAHPDLASELRALRTSWDDVSGVLGAFGAHASLSAKLTQMFGPDVDPQVELDQDSAKEGSGSASKLVERLRDTGPRGTRYRLLGEVARGGMGAILRVWDDALRRALAMKVVLGRDEKSDETPAVDPKTLGRFLEEAQITGQLDHPGIVPVHELGLGADGRVYFTMRLVKGVDLRRVFEMVERGEDGWNPTRALGVLLRVCEAMSYAHAKGVIHRDLKPANVMVGKFGEVYVMDWGLARVLGREDKHDLRIKAETPATSASIKTERRESREETPDSPLVTMDGDVVGTPSYMPPEQAKGQLEQLGPWSDVYSLGAMLYQLVSGEMPYVPRGARMSQHTVLLAVIAGAPKPLFDLAPRTPAELVAICEKAMSREPSQRYRDMQAFADDLRAYLEGRVVRAYETGTWAETRKWVQRNKALALALASFVATLLAAVLMATLLYRRSVRGETAARANESRANAKALEAQDLAAEASRQREAAEEAKTRSDKLKRELEEMAGSLSSTLTELGNLLEERGELRAAEPLFRRATESASRSLGDDNALTIASKANLAHLLLSQGKLTEAEGLFRDSWERSESVLGSDSPVTIAALNNLSSVSHSMGKLQEALPLAEEVVVRRRRILGDAHPDTLTSINNLAALQFASGELGSAEALWRELLAARRSVLPEGHPDTLTSISNLASVLAARNDLAEADSLLHDALAKSRSVLGNQHPDTLRLISKLASVESAIGSLGDAEALCREAVTGLRKVLGSDHPTTLKAVTELASVLDAQEKLPEAEALLREALERSARVLGADHPDVIRTRELLIQLYQKWHQLDPAAGHDVQARQLMDTTKR